jgi:predicted ABC-type ATPase
VSASSGSASSTRTAISSHASAVAKECERFVLDHIERRESFAVETTLRTTASIDQAEIARKNGFATEMHFVARRSSKCVAWESPA